MQALYYDLKYELLAYQSRYYPNFFAKLLKLNKDLLPITTYLIKQQKINYMDFKFKHCPISIDLNELIQYGSLSNIEYMVEKGVVIEFKHLISAINSKDFEKANYVFNNYREVKGIDNILGGFSSFITQDFKYIMLDKKEYQQFVECLVNNTYLFECYVNCYQDLDISVSNYREC